jgi:hypothetical protein
LSFINNFFSGFEKNHYFFFKAKFFSLQRKNNSFFVCVRGKSKEFFFDIKTKGIAIDDVYTNINILNHRCCSSKNIIKKNLDQHFKDGKEGFDAMPKFFYFIPKFLSCSEIFSHFTEVNCYRSDFFFLKAKSLDPLKNTSIIDIPLDIPDNIFFGDLFLEKCLPSELDFKQEIYEIFYQDMFFFGPYKLFKKSLTFKAQYNIDITLFKDNIVVKENKKEGVA